MASQTIKYSLSLTLNGGGSGASQSMVWEFTHIYDLGVIELDPGGLNYHILQGIGDGHTRVDDNGAGLVQFNPAGAYDLINHPPASPTIVDAVDIDARVIQQVATGVFTIEDAEYFEIGAQNIPGDLQIPSFKIVRIGIDYF